VTQLMVLDILRSALITVVKISLPVLLVAMIVGLAISVMQAVTQVQEQTLSFVPKILSVLLSLVIFGNYIMATIIDFTENLYKIIGTIV
jgi:flagellar biosynthetic protein FliQ